MLTEKSTNVRNVVTKGDEVLESRVLGSTLLHMLNPVTAKNVWLPWWYLSYDNIIQKIFEGELFIETVSTTLLQIVYELMLHSEVIFKSMTGPVETYRIDL